MGKQVGFFAIEQDQQELIYLVEQLGCSAIPALVPDDIIPEAAPPSHYVLPESDRYFYLLPPGIPPAEAFYEETVNDPTWLILMPYVSPVIQFLPSQRSKNIVQDGRFFIGLDNGDQFYKRLEHTYNRVARHVRKWELIKEHRLYVGPHTAKLARSGAIQLKFQFLPISLS